MNDEHEDGALVTAEAGTVALLNRSEIDMQIATARKFPRSIKRFRDEALQMVTLNEVIAGECFYALPRKQRDPQTGRQVNVLIEGPSARFGEIVASAWGNCRAGARVVSDAGEFVTAQGVFHDLERNVAITYEVQRRIVGSSGNRYSADMIGVTANAACSIALRNSILKGVPKAFWSDLYVAARQCAVGDFKTLANRRRDALAELQKFGIGADKVCSHLNIQGVEDITLEHLLILRGLITALRDGDTTPEKAFAQDDGASSPPPAPAMPPRKTPAAEAPPPAPEPAPPSGMTSGGIAPAAAPEASPPSEDLRPPAPAPADPPPPPAATTGEFQATPGEKQNLKVRAQRANRPIGEVLQKIGAAHVDPVTLDGMTKEQWKAAKRELEGEA